VLVGIIYAATIWLVNHQFKKPIEVIESLIS